MGTASSLSTAMDPARLRERAGEAAAFLRTMANPDRLMLLCALLEGERCVGDLEAETGLRQPSLSQQLGVLRDQGLVAARRDGKFVHYSVASGHALQLLELLHSLFCAPPPRRARAAKVSR